VVHLLGTGETEANPSVAVGAVQRDQAASWTSPGTPLRPASSTGGADPGPSYRPTIGPGGIGPRARRRRTTSHLHTQAAEERPHSAGVAGGSDLEKLTTSIVAEHNPPLLMRQLRQNDRDLLVPLRDLFIRLFSGQLEEIPKARRPSELLVTLHRRRVFAPQLTRSHITFRIIRKYL